MGRQGGDDGTSTTELVLVMPIVLLAVMLVVQAGLYFHARQVVQAAAQEALEAAQGESGDSEAGRLRAESFLEETGGVREPTVEVARGVDRVRAQVRAAAPNVLPGAIWQVTGTVQGPAEQFLPENQR